MAVDVQKDAITWGVHEQQAAPFICPEFKEQVADGVVYLRGSCQRATCVRWKAGQCRMCATTKTEQQDLFERRS
jgi:hypothetical protein